MFRLFIPWYIPFECNTYINKDKKYMLNIFDKSLFFIRFTPEVINIYYFYYEVFRVSNLNTTEEAKFVLELTGISS